MLRRLAQPVRSIVTRKGMSSVRYLTLSPGPWKHLHHPLGVVPKGTDRQAVRSKWGSDAMDKIEHTEVIEVDGDVAVCAGAGGALGHPVEYIKLVVSDEDAGPQVCKYCGLKFVRKHHH